MSYDFTGQRNVHYNGEQTWSFGVSEIIPSHVLWDYQGKKWMQS